MSTRSILTWGSWLGAVALLSGAPVVAQQHRAAPAPKPPGNEVCLGCHGDPSATGSNGQPIGVDADHFAGSSHGQAGLKCVDCHADLAATEEFPHAKPAPVDCSRCHADAASAYATSIHAVARRNGHPDAATCSDCHSAHDIRPASDPQSRTYPLNLPATCGRCHGNAALIQKNQIQIGNVVALYNDSIHGKAITQDGLLVAANCTSCHGHHDIRRKDDPASTVYRTNIPATCGTCHEGIEAQYQQGIHGVQLAKGNPKAPVCTDCHTAHGIQRADVASWQLGVIRECGTCHVDKIQTYRDTFHGQVTSLGFVRVATCADCHGAHAIYPTSDARSTVSPAHRLATCQKCHADATAGFAEYDPHADAGNKAQNATLYYTAGFMKWLLIGVFGFFGLHTALWLPRSVVARRRKTKDGDAPPRNRS